MQSFQSMLNGPRAMSLDTMLKMNDISPDIQAHLKSVYAALSLGVLVSAAGAYFHLATQLGGLLSLLAALGCILWLHADPDRSNQTKRLGIFAAFTFFQGMTLGGLVEVILIADPSILLTAFLGATAVFLCFSFAALLSPRRSYLYLGGILGSALSLMLLLSFVNFFVRSGTMFSFQLYAGLLMFCGYIVFDTQVIIEKAFLGDKDIAAHATELFTDFIAVFVRLAIILLRNSERRKK